MAGDSEGQAGRFQQLSIPGYWSMSCGAGCPGYWSMSRGAGCPGYWSMSRGVRQGLKKSGDEVQKEWGSKARL